MSSSVQVGVGVIVQEAVSSTRFLVARRKGKHGFGQLSAPGGHLEVGESFVDCAKREVMEETNLAIEDIKYQTTLNTIFSPSKHYVTIIMKGVASNPASLKNMEPEKSEDWEWIEKETIRNSNEVFLPLRMFLDQNTE